MSSDYQNFGIATPKVLIYDALPNINTNPVRSSFDISAASFNELQRSPFFPPFLMEGVLDNDGTFSAMFPLKRKHFVNNFMANSNSLKDFKSANPDENTFITWTATNKLPSVTSLTKEFARFKNEDLTSKKDNNYTPVWEDYPIAQPPKPDDRVSIAQYKAQMMSGVDLVATPTTPPPATGEEKYMEVITQRKVLDGMWWGAESHAFLTDQMPFWITIKKYDSPTATSGLDTFLVVSLGQNDSGNRYDLILSANNKPRLLDYIATSTNTSGSASSNVTYRTKEWDSDTARILHNEQDIEIGFMVIAGRLVISVNKEILVYTRIDNSDNKGGTIREAKLAAGPVAVYGTNISAQFYASPMTFANEAMCALPIPSLEQFAQNKEPLIWYGVDTQGNASGSVGELPKPPSVKQKIFGIDCKRFTYGESSATPSGLGFHLKGTITLSKADKTKAYASLVGTDFYVLAMETEDGKMKDTSGGDAIVPLGGCPFYFRLKGTTKAQQATSGGQSVNVTDNVISISESANAGDYFSFKRQASVTLYNPNGLYSGWLGKQKGIRISWGWNNEQPEGYSFTGIVTSYVTSEKAGMETITLECQDYMFILDKVVICNSPYYDGMLASRAMVDVALRAGCIGPQIDWVNEEEYFLPSGFSYTQPRFHFKPQDTMLRIIQDFAKYCEGYCYFDGNGVFHVAKLPGGLFSVYNASRTPIKAAFVQNPSSDPKDHVVLGEKSVTHDYSSTVNVICIFTLDRNTRNIIVESQDAQHSTGNRILFRRPLLIDQPAYGALEVAKNYAKELGRRIYKKILKTNFKTVGFLWNGNPFDYVTLNGQIFRLMGIKRAYSAESNDFTQDYECEWLGG